MSKPGYDIVIIGGGPAGYTAAIYASRANLKTLVIAGITSGGQLMLTREVENYPGFSNGILGPDLMENMRMQAERMGAEIIYEDATGVDFSKYPPRVYVEDREITAKAVIVATGASPRWLGLESEKRLLGRGVSSCATCDGPLFRNAPRAVVVGGGDTAMEYALFLANLVGRVVVVHRRDKLRASKVMAERALSNPRIEFLWNSVVVDILGDSRVEGVRVRDIVKNVEQTIDCQAVFVAIGHEPNTQIFRGQLAMDDAGYIIVDNRLRTSAAGVFAAGDVHDHRYRQAITAAGFGCMAAMEAIWFIESGEAESVAEKVFQPLKT